MLFRKTKFFGLEEIRCEKCDSSRIILSSKTGAIRCIVCKHRKEIRPMLVLTLFNKAKELIKKHIYKIGDIAITLCLFVGAIVFLMLAHGTL